VKVLFDGQIFVEQRAGGVSRYFTTLAESLSAQPGVSARIIAPLHRNEILSASAMAPVFGVGLPDKRGVHRLCRLVLKATAPVLSPLFGADIVHETFFSPAPFLTRTRRRITTMYDMIHEIYFPGNPTTAHKKAALARCDHVICISHNTRKDLCELFDFPAERTSVTHLAYKDFSGFAGYAPPSELSGAPYFLFVGNRSAYKNFDALLRALAGAPRLAGSFRIACYGGGPLTDNERAAAGALGLAPEAVIHLRGGDDVLGAAYANATAFVYPSLYEGFGIPPLEAMSASCPVLSSNTSSLPEVVGDAGLLFEPKDIEALRDALLCVAESSTVREDLVRRGHARRALFSWERCVEQTLAIYRSVL
jgi:glycosyltransferase involved in cell wall biosynthesis